MKNKAIVLFFLMTTVVTMLLMFLAINVEAIGRMEMYYISIVFFYLTMSLWVVTVLFWKKIPQKGYLLAASFNTLLCSGSFYIIFNFLSMC